MVACHDQVRKGGLEGGSVKYLIVAEAYRDLEQASGRLVLIERMAELVTQTPAELLPTVCYLCQGQIALIVAEAYRDLEQASGRLVLIERMAELVTQTPAELLPTVCYLCQGQIAPEFAGIDLGLAEKMAIRALAAATGAETAQVAAYVRETGDLGQAAEQLLADSAAGRAASLDVVTVVRTLRQIAAAEGQGSQGRKLELLGGLLGRATPLEARYLLRLVTGNLRLGIGTPTILDALAQVYAGGRAQRKVLERGYNICCDIGLVASTLVSGGLTAVEKLHVQAGNPVRAMLAQRLSDAGEILAKLGGRCSAEYKYDWASARPPSWTRWPRSTRAGEPSARCLSAATTSAATSAWSRPRWSAAG